MRGSRLMALVTGVTPIAAALLAVPTPAQAVTQIVITSLADVAANDGTCTLREALTAANSDTVSGAAAGECPAGSGYDSLLFGVAGTVALSAKLPEIESDLEIEGGGYATIDGQGYSVVFSEPGTTVTIRNLTITGGSALYGSAVFNSGTMRLERVRVTGNTIGDYGVVLSASGTTLEVIDSTIDGNSGSSGAVYVGNDTEATIVGSTISGNSFSASGTIIVQGSLTLANSTVADNLAGGNGGGIYQSGGFASTLTIVNSTISGNSASTDGGGVSFNQSATAVVRNSIIAGNTAPAQADVSGQVDEQTTSLVGVPVLGLLDPAGLQDNGGPTKTIGLVATAASALDQATGSVCSSAPVDAVDQRGLSRPAGACDIGAVERDVVAPGAVSGPSVALGTGASLKGTKVTARVRWGAASDGAGSGIAGYVVEQSTGSGPFRRVGRPVATQLDRAVTPRRTVRFRIAAVDRDGNRGPWTTTRPATVRVAQESAATFKGAWTVRTRAAYAGGTARRSVKAGASATYAFRGRGVGLVGLRGPGQGRARIYVDGALATTVDFGGASAYRYQAWSRSWSSSKPHKIRVVVVGTAGRPAVDIDALLVLGP